MQLFKKNQTIFFIKYFLRKVYLIFLLGIYPFPTIAEDWDTLSQQAISTHQKGDYKNAIELAKQALEIARIQYGKKHSYTMDSILILAIFYREQGRYQQAERLYKEALALNTQAFGEQHPSTLDAMNNLAGLYRDQGQYQQAEILYTKTLILSQKTLGKQHPSTLIPMINLGAIYRNQGQYQQAKLLLEQTLALGKQILGEQHPNTLRFMDNLAALYHHQGQYQQAELLLNQTLALKTQVLGEQHSETLESMISLAEVYRIQGQYQQAELLLSQILEVRKEAPDEQNFNMRAFTNNLAGLYHIQGKYQQAESLYKQSLTLSTHISGKKHPETLTVMLNLAMLYLDQAQYKHAEPLLKQTLALSKQVLGKMHPNTLATMNNLALLYHYQNKFQKTEPLLKKVLVLSKEVLGEQHLHTLSTMNNLARLYMDKNQYQQAEILFKQTLALKKKELGMQHPNTLNSINNLAILYQITENWGKAENLWRQSLKFSNQILMKWLWMASKKTRQSYLQQQEFNKHNYLSFYSFRNLPEDAFYFSLSRKSLLLQIASEISALSKNITDPETKKLADSFKEKKQQLANLAFSNKANPDYVKTLEEEINTLEMQLSQKVSAFKRNKTEVLPKDVLAKLKSNQILIDFLVYTEIDLKTQEYKTEQIIALIADKQNGIKLIKLGELAPIAKAIKTYQTAIVPTEENENSREQILKQTAQTLYQQLWQPLTPYLKNKTSAYLIPDGDLHLLPFKALQDENGNYLAEKIHLITLSSARDIVLPPLEGEAKQSAIFAPHVYGDVSQIINSNTTASASEPKKIYFKPLSQALQEGQQIDILFRQKQPDSPAKLFKKAHATEHAISNINNPKILHLATHGFYLGDNQLNTKALDNISGLMQNIDPSKPQIMVDNPLTRSGLAFANANLGIQKDNTDGILTALEVLNLDLAGTELVTLSACDTSQGEVKIGEGVYSLNRAFQEAGAKAVLSTLWKVDDKATSEFMQNFYNRFLGGIPAQQAIQQTQEDFMQHENKKYKNPFYWAGFVMTGKE